MSWKAGRPASSGVPGPALRDKGQLGALVRQEVAGHLPEGRRHSLVAKGLVPGKEWGSIMKSDNP